MPVTNNSVNRSPIMGMGANLNQTLSDTPTPGWWDTINSSNPVYDKPISNWQDQARDLLGSLDQKFDPNQAQSLEDTLSKLQSMDRMNARKYALQRLMWMLHQNELIRNPSIPLSPYGQWM